METPETFPNIELFHVHIPKTAGTSLNAMFERVLGNSFCNHDPDRLRSDPRIRIAASHIPLRAARRKFPKAEFVTILREPESRMKSALRHFYARRKWPAYAHMAPLINSLIDSDGYFRPKPELIEHAEFRNRFDNPIIRYLTPDPILDRVSGGHAESAVDAASALRYVLFQDHFAEGVAGLFADLGFPETQEQEANRVKTRIPLWESLPSELEPFLVHDRAAYHTLMSSRQ